MDVELDDSELGLCSGKCLLEIRYAFARAEQVHVLLSEPAPTRRVSARCHAALTPSSPGKARGRQAVRASIGGEPIEVGIRRRVGSRTSQAQGRSGGGEEDEEVDV